MAKKYFDAPYLKVVRVHNDIIATSGENMLLGNSWSSGEAEAPGRGFDEDEYEDWE